MTKDMFITELIRSLQNNEKVKEVIHIPTANVFVTFNNGDTFKLVVGVKTRR